MSFVCAIGRNKKDNDGCEVTWPKLVECKFVRAFYTYTYSIYITYNSSVDYFTLVWKENKSKIYLKLY